MSQYLPRFGLALAIFVASLSIRAAERAAKPFALLGKGGVADGRLMAPFYDYMIWPHAVEDKGTVYCVFSNARAQPIVMAYDTAAQRFSGPVKVSEFGLKNDDHGNPALCLDSKGHLHVSTTSITSSDRPTGSGRRPRARR